MAGVLICAGIYGGLFSREHAFENLIDYGGIEEIENLKSTNKKGTSPAGRQHYISRSTTELVLISRFRTSMGGKSYYIIYLFTLFLPLRMTTPL
jgi:hypothetical protein